MGGKQLAAAIRRINKGKKANEPVFDPALLPPGSIIAVDLSTFLVPFIKSDAGTAQLTSVPLQSCTSVRDKLEVMYTKKVEPYQWKMVLVVDATFAFKDQVVRQSRNKVKETAARTVASIRSLENFDTALVKRLRRAEKGMVNVTCDVVANAVEWSKKRPGITSVIMIVILLYIYTIVISSCCLVLQVIGSPFEADAQSAHLVQIGFADAAATTDSDLLSFKCPLILYGHLSGNKKPGAMVRWGNTCSLEINKLSAQELVTATCLTGCDYIPRLHGMSLKKAIEKTLSWREKVCTHMCILLYYKHTHYLPPTDQRRNIRGREQDGTSWHLATVCKPRIVPPHD